MRQDQGVVFYGLAELELGEVIEIFRSRTDAEAALRAVLQDEPGWAPILTTARLEYRDGAFEIELAPPLLAKRPIATPPARPSVTWMP